MKRLSLYQWGVLYALYAARGGWITPALMAPDRAGVERARRALNRLANAGLAEMEMHNGAARYRLDMSRRATAAQTLLEHAHKLRALAPA